MKRIAFAVGVVVFVFGVAILAQTQSESMEQELMRLENAWNDALVKHDWAFLDQILADDYTSTERDGNVSTKALGMANLKSGETVIISAVADDFKVRVYGDAAVINFRLTYKNQVQGKESTGQDQITDVWIKRGGRWQCVASHSSQIAQK